MTDTTAPTGAIEAKHTPGPWKLFRPHRESFWHVNQADGPGYVCDAPMYEHRAVECEANANLIAAAPDLLEVLQTIVRVADGRTIPGNLILDENSPLMDAARDAIAKATGDAAIGRSL